MGQERAASVSLSRPQLERQSATKQLMAEKTIAIAIKLPLTAENGQTFSERPTLFEMRVVECGGENWREASS